MRTFACWSTCASAAESVAPSTRGRTRDAFSRRWPRPESSTAIAETSPRRLSLRRLQYREDARQGVGKRSRIELAPEYRERYTREILDQVDLGSLVAELPADAASALLCVERDPEACHRSLIAERLASEHGLVVAHLRP